MPQGSKDSHMLLHTFSQSSSCSWSLFDLKISCWPLSSSRKASVTAGWKYLWKHRGSQDRASVFKMFAWQRVLAAKMCSYKGFSKCLSLQCIPFVNVGRYHTLWSLEALSEETKIILPQGLHLPILPSHQYDFNQLIVAPP